MKNEQNRDFILATGHRHELKALAVGVAIIGVASLRLQGVESGETAFRDQIPEPFDVVDHIGNIAPSYTATALVHKYRYLKEAIIDGPTLTTPEVAAKMRKTYFLGVLGLNTAINAVAETVGYGEVSTADPLDFTWGILAGMLAHRYMRPQELSMSRSELEEMKRKGLLKKSVAKQFERIKKTRKRN